MTATRPIHSSSRFRWTCCWRSNSTWRRKRASRSSVSLTGKVAVMVSCRFMGFWLALLRSGLYLFFDVIPQGIVNRIEPRCFMDMEHVTWPGQIDVVDLFDRSRRVSEYDNPVGERDAFHQIVGHKEHRLLSSAPQ